MSLTVSPASLTFPPTAVDPDCLGDNCTHADVTITGASCTFQWGFSPRSPASGVTPARSRSRAEQP